MSRLKNGDVVKKGNTTYTCLGDKTIVKSPTTSARSIGTTAASKQLYGK